MSEEAEPNKTWRGVWILASIVVVAVLAFGLAVLGKGFDINFMDRLKIAVATDDKYIEVVKFLRQDEDAIIADAEGLLGSRGFYRLGLEDEPIQSQQVASILEAKGYYHLGEESEPIKSQEIESLLNSKGFYSIESNELYSALERRGYYHIGGQDLLSAIRRFEVSEFDPDPDLAKANASRMRNELLDMMGTLTGPFDVGEPGLLWGTSTEFLRALDQLKETLDARRERLTALTEDALVEEGRELAASDFLTAFWLAMADRRSVFGLTKFEATVRVLDDDEGPRIYVCDEDEYLAARGLQLRTNPDNPLGFGFTRTYTAVAHPGACFTDSPELAEALAGRPIPIAINPSTAREMFGDNEVTVEPGTQFRAIATLTPGRSTSPMTARAE